MKQPRFFLMGLMLAAGMLLGVGLLAGAGARAQGGPTHPVYIPLLARVFQGPFDTPAPMPSATATPTQPPTPVPTDTPEPTEVPSVTPTPPPTVTPTPAGPAWLAYVNYHRGLAKLPKVVENAVWSRGDRLHAKYMVKNDVIGHSEEAGKPFYTTEGNEAAKNGNVAVHSQAGQLPQVPIDMWMTGPFHMLGIIDPMLTTSGFGDYSETDGNIQYGATLDVLRGRAGPLPPSVKFPVRYPEANMVLPNLTYDGVEAPDPLLACSGFKAPTGPPLAIQFGAGDTPPKVSKVVFKNADGKELPNCWFDEKKYPNALGQAVLKMRSAVIILPKSPLDAGAKYALAVTNAGQTMEWSFRTAAESPMPLH